MRGGVSYDRITAQGLWVGTPDGPQLIAADTIVLCAGQEPARGLADALTARGRPPHIIGGADRAAELDAKRAIDQGTRLARNPLGVVSCPALIELNPRNCQSAVPFPPRLAVTPDP